MKRPPTRNKDTSAPLPKHSKASCIITCAPSQASTPSWRPRRKKRRRQKGMERVRYCYSCCSHCCHRCRCCCRWSSLAAWCCCWRLWCHPPWARATTRRTWITQGEGMRLYAHARTSSLVTLGCLPRSLTDEAFLVADPLPRTSSCE